MRRKAGTLVPLEVSIVLALFRLERSGIAASHGYEIARHLAAASDVKLLTAYGTLYRALGRLEQMGLLASEWEDPQLAAEAARPGRRLYSLTGAGTSAARAHAPASTAKKPIRRRQAARA